ncbi:bifunctional 2-keto-4-hydroxyglutarate aldolase/2-keto-3-deoxy-6-phosphogluconate aldolase [Halanaerobiaceae bacterium Z-7014]|uniref:Bifunctional 2-keto-4-hydroxyglutarate aldolase/2-keto-3-deoxy-6-phosphogluconate aldolase n=1 Tax=Halonatronomonas betaini TaxID=2778430 RepID=A0A931ARL0_9FIRM|nr:bifunctional 2-keto-4-hydroxyglutarate aldolase/2-keto-3-deoxy-6-phosphogluconate aldolase [Halonatronomonas betaini]MBF8435570.1 bifunctional 2-keto-4-hydroxyglutarate aldolase/2-keto-3-deoxy-6-phosphogluconate aldolase [Halonatronomonas betaini]
MTKQEVISGLEDSGVVAVIRADKIETAEQIVEAIVEGGITAIEVTMTVPNAFDLIKKLSKKYQGSDVLVGAGSVTDAVSAKNSIDAGAKYIVGPTFDQDVVNICNEFQVPVIPGAMSPTEVVNAMKAGADIVKIFPATLFGPKIIKAIKGPIPHAPLLPTGGVNLDNVQDWFEAGACAVGVGSALSKGWKEGKFDQITEQAKQFKEKVALIKKEL